MDVDWCLTCGRRLNESTTYCSRECRSHDDPLPFVFQSRSDVSPPPSEDEDQGDQILYHEPKSTSPTRWVGAGAAGIIAWASDIPPGAAGAPSPNDIPFSYPPPPALPSPPSPTSPPLHVFHPPKLLLPHKRPVPPTLCVWTSAASGPLHAFPIFTQQQPVAMLSHSQPCDVGKVNKMSLQSAIAESFVTTPSSVTAAEPIPVPRKSSVFNAFATLRSWVTPGFVAPPSKTSLKRRPFSSTKTTNHHRHAFADKLVKVALDTKFHHPPAPYGASPVPSSLPKKTFADGGEFPLWQAKTSSSPSVGEGKEANDVDWRIRVVARPYPHFAARGRNTCRAIP